MKTYLQIFIGAFLLLSLTTSPVYSQSFGVNLNHEPGHIDSTFGTGGTSRIGVNGSYGLLGGTNGGLIQVVSMVIAPDGKIIEGGYVRPPSSLDAFAVARFDSDGTPDNTFGTNGAVWTYLDGTGEDQAFSVAVQPDGKIVEAGLSQDRSQPYNYEFGIVRFDSNGILDNSFGTNGYVKTYIPGGTQANDRAFSVVIQKDGKIVVSGMSSYDSSGVFGSCFAMLRLNSDGSIDNSFGTNGFLRAVKMFLPNGSNTIINTIIQPNGKFLVAISNGKDSNFNQSYLLRVNENGTLDSSFTINGQVNYSFGGGGYETRLHSIALQSDGKIVEAGESGYYGQVVFITRFNQDGTLDNTFGTGGFYVFFDNGMNFPLTESSYSVAVQSDGKILAAGYSVSNFDHRFHFLAVRFDSSGAVDSSFGTNGSAETFITGGSDSNDVATAVAIQSDGKIVLGGASQNVWQSANRFSSFAAARFYGGNSNIAKIELNRKVISFGDVVEGETSDTGLIIFNNGYDTLKINKITSTNNSFFAKTNSVNILPDRSFPDTVIFKPDSSGYFQGKLIVFSNAINSPDTILVNGTGKQTTGIKENNSKVPGEYSLEQNYPNPFNPSTVIRFNVANSALVILKVYDILGKEVKTLVNKVERAGSHSVTFNAGSLPSGVYLYRLKAGAYSAVKKLLVLK